MWQSISADSVIIVVPDDHEFKIPKRLVKIPMDMQIWERSEACKDYLGFILSLNEIVKTKPISTPCIVSDNVTGIVTLLNKLDKFIDEVEPIPSQKDVRLAFQQWYNYLEPKAHELMQKSIPEKFHRAICEVVVYFLDGFGNCSSIDYGIKHELSFIMFLCCLFKIGVFAEEDKLAIAFHIFPRYLEVVRKLQQTYKMKPAGSRGVWSLDDYQFVPFIWGSSQLIANPKIQPSSFLDNSVLKEFSKEYMFLSCIEYIKQIKTGPFGEHSNQLWNITGVTHWSNVNSALIKMYKTEVLRCFSVINQCIFGSLLPFNYATPNYAAPGRVSLSTLSSMGSSGSEDEEHSHDDEPPLIIPDADKDDDDDDNII